MATTVHEPPKLQQPSQGDGGWSQRPPIARRVLADGDSSPASRTGVWVGVSAITMTFAAFTSAMIVRQGSSNDWQHFTLPPILYLNTVILLASGVTLEVSRRRVATFLKTAAGRRPALLWLLITVGLGLVFVAGQYAAWLQLRAQGLYMSTNPSSAFFYLFTALHAVHVIGGLAGFALVLWRFSRPVPTLRVSTMSTVAYYWHFMSVLWIYLLLLLWMRV